MTDAAKFRELLYENDRPIASNARPSRVHVDDTHVYWAAAFHGYFRGSKNGSGSRQRLADYEGVLMPRAIQTDQANIYLKQEPGVEVVARDGSTRRLVPAPVPFGTSGAFDVWDGRLIFANVTCESLAVTGLDGSNPIVGTLDNGAEVGGGTNVVVAAGAVYCINAGRAVRWDMTSKAPEVVFNLSDGYHSFRALAASAEALFLIEYGMGGQTQDLMRVALPAPAGTAPTTLCSGDRGGVSSLHYDPVRQALYWPRQESNQALDLRSCSLTAAPGGPTVRLEQYQSQGQDVQGFDGDATHFYWADEYGVWRAPKPAS